MAKTKDISAQLIEKLSTIRHSLPEGSEQFQQLSEVVACLHSTLVKMTYSFPDPSYHRPGDVMTPEELDKLLEIKRKYRTMPVPF